VTKVINRTKLRKNVLPARALPECATNGTAEHNPFI